jgi:hypothetical protein
MRYMQGYTESDTVSDRVMVKRSVSVQASLHSESTSLVDASVSDLVAAPGLGASLSWQRLPVGGRPP